ncbi:MAG: hypothetical protein D3913_13750 [Candidatus Electrothrix sp. LOE1_4_5]|nr:hypothetical protein [Candidatus Electrothrix gigas]
MLLISKVIVFLVGMCLAVQVVAAFYRILDCWHTIRTEYLAVLKGLFLCFSISGLCAVLVGENLRNAFLWGMALYIPFYLVSFFFLQFIIRYRYKRGEPTIQKEQQEQQEKTL